MEQLFRNFAAGGGGVVRCGVLGAPSRVICGRGDGRQGGGKRERGRTDRRRSGQTDGGSRRTDTILPRLAATSRMAPKNGYCSKKASPPSCARACVEWNTDAPNCTMHSFSFIAPPVSLPVYASPTIFQARWHFHPTRQVSQTAQFKSKWDRGNICYYSVLSPFDLNRARGRPADDEAGGGGGTATDRRRRALNNEFGMHISYSPRCPPPLPLSLPRPLREYIPRRG